MRHTPVALSLAAIAALALAGCNDQPAARPEAAVPGVAQPKGDLQNLPKWVLNPNHDERYSLAAAGVARASMGGIAQQMTFAEQDGRVRIAQSIETQVKGLVEQFYSQGGEPGGAERADQVQRTINQSVTNVVSSGVMRVDMYRDTSDGTLYVWMVIDPKKQNDIAASVAKVASKAAAERAQVKAELKADDMVQRLEKAINDKLAAGK